jgi:hypothetical protein
MVLYGIRNGFNAAIFADDFLDSNDDGVISAKDNEVDVSQGDLVLNLQAVLERAFGPSDYAGEQKVVLQDITSIDADTVRPPEGVNTSDWLHEDDITIA